MIRTLVTAILGFVAAAIAAGLFNAAKAAYAASNTDPLLLYTAFLAALVFSVVPMIFAVPLFIALHFARLVNLWTSLAAGTLLGALFGLLIRLGSPQLGDVIAMAPYGTVAALAFWLVWRTGRSREKEASS